MTTITHSTEQFSTTARHRATAALMIVLFWAAAAIVVATVHTMLDSRSPSAAAVVTFAALFISAYAYTRMYAPQSSISHALGVGIAWLLLTIVTEIALSAYTGHDWYALLGSPDRPLLRNLFLFGWIFAPAMTA